MGAAGFFISVLAYNMVVMVVSGIDCLTGTSKYQNRETNYTLPTTEIANLIIKSLRYSITMTVTSSECEVCVQVDVV